MTRIFDALKKAGHAAPAPAPLPVAAVRGATAPAIREERAPRVAGFPLAGAPLPDDDVLQQMSSLQVTLEAALPDRACRTIAFVSSQGGEGTTSVAHQFAAALARDERIRTVIADGHARNPSLLHDPEQRLVRLLRRDGAPRETRVAMNLHGWPLPGDVLDAGLFQPAAARVAIEALSASYDWVILDLPPALEAPDSAALAAIADGTVLVVRSGRTKRPVVTRAAELLRTAGARVIGTVLNRRRLEIPDFIYKRI